MLEFCFFLENSILIHISNFKFSLIIVFYVKFKRCWGGHSLARIGNNEPNLRIKWVTYPPLKRAANCPRLTKGGHIFPTILRTSQAIQKHWESWGIPRKYGCQPAERSVRVKDAFSSPKPGDGISKALSQRDCGCLEKGKAGSLSEMAI